MEEASPCFVLDVGCVRVNLEQGVRCVRIPQHEHSTVCFCVIEAAKLRKFTSHCTSVWHHYLESWTLINGLEVFAVRARGKQGFIIVGELVVVLNCEFNVFVKGRGVVVTTGHL